ncbi:MAG TPA: uroporphyrinogen decarboxylase family protein, partial [Oceanipulchritudo sp.]|nr:uroporphyrinogen decarboxylase family protein [Oceanipulchritudo sp.]
DYLCNPGIDARLKAHYRLHPEDDEGLRNALGVDFRNVEAPFNGPIRFDPLPGRRINEWGIHTRWIEHASGGYWDYCDFPLQDADLEQILEWPIPEVDDFDYAELVEQCRRWKDFYLVLGNPGVGDFINHTGMLRSMEMVLMDLYEGEEETLALFDRRLNLQLKMLERCLDLAKGTIDMLWIGDDLGTQIAPILSSELFRQHLRPRHQKLVDLGKAYGATVMIHSCGSSSWAFDDFIEMGIEVVDTLQPEARNMDPAYLKSKYGQRLSFHGCISTAGPVVAGTVEETVAYVREKLDILMPGGGYALAPTHQLQDNSRTENVIALYETAREYGRYRK